MFMSGYLFNSFHTREGFFHSFGALFNGRVAAYTANRQFHCNLLWWSVILQRFHKYLPPTIYLLAKHIEDINFTRLESIATIFVWSENKT
jgi:hypothetical protein